MRNKISALLLVTVLCMTGCGSSDKKETTQTQEPQSTSISTEATTETASPGADNTDDKTAQSSPEYKTDNVKITNADDALTRLKEGNKRFVDNKSELVNVTSERRDELMEGQTPYAVVVSCSDSRVTPTTVFNAGLGEIFDIRIAGNVVDNDAMGSIEYGVEHLHSPLLIVMGHEKCGAVTAAYDKVKKGTKVEGNINSIVDKIEPAIKDAEDLNEAIHENIDNVTDQIEKNTIIKHLVDQGKLKVVKAYYSLDGTVLFEED